MKVFKTMCCIFLFLIFINISYADECPVAVQGRIAWDYQGHKTWKPDNVNRLCNGAKTDEPAVCFQRVMHGGANLGGGIQWKWQDALNLCKGTSSTDRTIRCYVLEFNRNANRKTAISKCNEQQRRLEARARTERIFREQAVKAAPPSAAVMAPRESAPQAEAIRRAPASEERSIARESAPSTAMAAAAEADEPPYSVVRVYYATDRNLTGKSDPADTYGNERSFVTYGSCEVSIPLNHEIGRVERPPAWWVFHESPERYVVLMHVTIKNEVDYFAEVAEKIKSSPGKNAFVFVHGYNVSFEDGALRTAQITYDIGFSGAPVFYSWPSQGKVEDYLTDETNIDWSRRRHMVSFLTDFFEKSTADNIYLIAHSMGNRGLTDSLITVFNDHPEYRPRVKEIILAAPDIDADVFKDDIAPALAGAGRPITLYASADDKALTASKEAHGYPRAGLISDGVIILPGIETIDASGIDTSFIAHSYFASVKSVLTDILNLVKKGLRARDRSSLVMERTPEGDYWRIK